MTDKLNSNQHSVTHPISASGIGNHTGQHVSITLCPATINHGIAFQRIDLDDAPIIKARFDRVADTQLSTIIADDQGNTVSTIEHLMAALGANGIDNALIKIDGPEMPMMDGSAAPFDLMIRMARPNKQSAKRKYIQILQDVSVTIGKASASLTPHDGQKISFKIDFDHPVIGQQTHTIDDYCMDGFRPDISRARSFGFLHQAKMLWDNGLAKGSNLNNIIVIGNPDLITGDNGQRLPMPAIRDKISDVPDAQLQPDQQKDQVLNKNGLRYVDEFVRHKVLDSIGDMALAGMPVIGHYHGVKAGHDVTNKLLRELFSDANNYAVITDKPAQAVREGRPASATTARQYVSNHDQAPVPHVSRGGAI